MGHRNSNRKKPEGERNEVLICTEDDFRVARPKCPDCGGDSTSRGDEWQCSVCMRRWTKVKVKRKPTASKRPFCIECSSAHVVSNGISWKCCNCGRSFIKVRRRIPK